MRPTLLLILALLPCSARADVWLQGGLNAIRQGTTPGPGLAEQKESRSVANATAAIAFLQGFMVGGQYLSARSAGSDVYAWGPKGGLFLGGLELTGAYLPVAKENYAGESREGGGFALNVGYHFRVAGPIHLGLQGTYWLMSFSEIDGVEVLGTNPKTRYLTPLFTLGLRF